MNVECAQSELLIAFGGLHAGIFVYVKSPQYQKYNQQQRMKYKYLLRENLKWPSNLMRARFKAFAWEDSVRIYHDKQNRRYWARIYIKAASLFPKHDVRDWLHGHNSVEHLTKLIKQSK